MGGGDLVGHLPGISAIKKLQQLGSSKEVASAKESHGW